VGKILAELAEKVIEDPRLNRPESLEIMLKKMKFELP
jgi:hypothetical protein